MSPSRSLTVLVTGATGYIGSRLVPRLLEAGHHVVAASRHEDGADDYPWVDDVDVRRFDIGDEDLIAAAVDGVDAVVYLVHSMESEDFVEKDRAAAERVARACEKADVSRIVYLSGLIPDDDDLSDHLRSRLEVEQVFLDSSVPTTVLRAAMVIGAGSTSYELLRRLSERVRPVLPVPAWMHSHIQPVAVEDVVALITSALTAEPGGEAPDRHYDIGGDQVLSYPELLRSFAEAKGIRQLQITVPFVPHAVVAWGCALISGLPRHEVSALTDSLSHDMVCGEDDARRELLGPDFSFVSVSEALHRALDPVGAPGTTAEGDAMAGAPTDPA